MIIMMTYSNISPDAWTTSNMHVSINKTMLSKYELLVQFTKQYTVTTNLLKMLLQD
jgi:hypothetical protein